MVAWVNHKARPVGRGRRAGRGRHSARRAPAFEPLEGRTLLSLATSLLYIPAPHEKLSLVPPGLWGKMQGNYWDVAEQVRRVTAGEDFGSAGQNGRFSDIDLVATRAARVDAGGSVQSYIHVLDWGASVFAGLQGLGTVPQATSEAMKVIQAWIPAELAD